MTLSLQPNNFSASEVTT